MATIELAQGDGAFRAMSRRGRSCRAMSRRACSHHARMLALLAALTVLFSCARHGMTDGETLAYAKAKSSYLQGDYEKAIAIVEGGRFNLRSSHQAFLLKAKCEFFLLHPERAEPILRKLLKRYPRYAEAELYLARALLAEGRFDAAQGEIEGALQWNPDDPRLLALMGSLHEAKREYQKAFEYYARSGDFADELAKSEVSLAELYWRFGQEKQALGRARLAKAMLSPKSILAKPLGELESRMAQGSVK